MSYTLIDLKKKRRLTNAEIAQALKLNVAKASRLLNGTYRGVVDATWWQIRDLAELFALPDGEILDALELSFRMSNEERSDQQVEYGLQYLSVLRKRFG